MQRYRDHVEAAEELAERVLEVISTAERPIVLALPRAGVPIAAAVARALSATLDVMVVLPIFVPGRPDECVGAMTSGGVRVLHGPAAARWGSEGLEAEVARLRPILRERERSLRGDRPPASLRGRTVVLVDDAIVTGATMDAAALAARVEGARRVIAAAPVGHPVGCRLVAPDVDMLVVARTGEDLAYAGDGYQVRQVVTDPEVHRALAHAERVAQ